MKQRELLFFEWVVVDNCNFNCVYCVNKGEYSQKSRKKMLYIPEREIEIARKIVELSNMAEKVIVNLTGGEPLLSKHLKEVISILRSKNNIHIRLITNFSLIETIAERLSDLEYVAVSLHIQHRAEYNLEHLIQLVNRFKTSVPIRLSQVDYNLSSSDRETLDTLSSATGLSITYQPFIPPWTEEGAIENGQKIRDATFVESLGKRCALGYFYYLLLPDGTFYFGTWCQATSRKTGNFLAPISENRPIFFSEEMAKCPSSSCGCNYNTFNYQAYVNACHALGYPLSEIFGKENLKSESLSQGNMLTRKLRRIFSLAYEHFTK